MATVVATVRNKFLRFLRHCTPQNPQVSGWEDLVLTVATVTVVLASNPVFSAGTKAKLSIYLSTVILTFTYGTLYNICTYIHTYIHTYILLLYRSTCAAYVRIFCTYDDMYKMCTVPVLYQNVQQYFISILPSLWVLFANKWSKH